jgi:hypothetical protein
MPTDVHIQDVDTAQVERVEKVCPNCNETYLIRKTESDKRECCSNKCALELRKERNGYRVSCEWCNDELIVGSTKYGNQDKFFCSIECNGLYQENHINKTLCPVCGAEYNTPRAMNIHKTKVHGNSGSEIRKCKNCENEFKIQRSSSKKYCSHDCYTKSNIGQDHNNWMEKEISECKTCGNNFKKYKSTEQNYCSRVCVDKGKTDIYYRTIKCTYCENRFSKRKKLITDDQRHFCSVNCSNQWLSENQTGKDNSNWSEELRPVNNYGPNWSLVRKQTRERDNYTCQKCDKNEEEFSKKLDVHHIIPFRLFDKFEHGNDLRNLITLCKSCHGKVEAVSYEEIDCINSEMVENIINDYNIETNTEMSGVTI